ncbi:aldo/keto reductase [Candidatus Saccharibacteria bacterium]|nr:aldo/keto reductase [Candidatus Saccharibacteria bacterium]
MARAVLLINKSRSYLLNEHTTVTLNDGTRMPQLGLGVWQAKDGDETRMAVKSAINAGYRMIDTAMVYQNERSVAQGIRDSGVNREELFITTKLWNSDQGSAAVRPAFEASLERLGLDYIDLYLIHWPTPERELYVETWKEFEKLKADGLVRSIGVSNFRTEDLERLKAETSTVPSVNQIELHPNFQQQALRDYATTNGIQIESWSPIGGSKGNLLNDETLQQIGAAHQKSPAQIVIRWHLQHGLVVIPKSVRAERQQENINVFDFELSPDEMKQIDSLETGVRTGPDPATMNNH